jgi:dTDP-4-dehydrorhamnose reductase
MLRLGAEREELAVVDDQIGSPTSAASIARALWQLVAIYQESGPLTWGVYHYAGAPACSWYEFASTIFDVASNAGLLDRVPTVRAIGTHDYPTPARRPAWSVMDSSRLEATFGIQASNWRDELAVMLQELSRSSNY